MYCTYLIVVKYCKLMIYISISQARSITYKICPVTLFHNPAKGANNFRPQIVRVLPPTMNQFIRKSPTKINL